MALVRLDSVVLYGFNGSAKAAVEDDQRRLKYFRRNLQVRLALAGAKSPANPAGMLMPQSLAMDTNNSGGQM